jgi:hypothetical protein
MKKHISVLILTVLRDSLLQVVPGSIDPTEPKGVARVNKLFGPLSGAAFSLVLGALFAFACWCPSQCAVPRDAAGFRSPDSTWDLPIE